MYLATHDDGRELALKVVRSDDAGTTRRFLREFESLRLLRVPGVVRVYDAGIEGERVWFSMDRVFGDYFHDQLISETYLPDRVDRTVTTARNLMETLAALHASGFAHRDLKPSNVLVDAGGAPHVLDFGVSRWFADENSSTDIVLGTVPYMAPEQVASLPVGPPADVFAAGLMIHEAIHGVPERPAHPLGWVARTCMDRRPPLATLYREVPLSLSKLVERMTAVEPSDRPTAGECAEELSRIAEGHKGNEWPEPPFADPGSWWAAAEGVLARDPRVCMLSGSAGSGRRRVAEQVQRIGLLEGTWSFRLNCAIERVGAPFHDLLSQLCDALRDDALAELAGSDFDAIAPLWPHLPMPRNVDGHTVSQSEQLAVAIARIVRRLGRSRTVVLMVDRLEEVDALSAAVLVELAREGPAMLLLHEHRWSTAGSRRLVRRLRKLGAANINVEPHHDPGAIAATLCPAAPPTIAKGTPPWTAVEAGWAALAEWRGESFEQIGQRLVALAAHPRPLPVPVLRRVAGRGADARTWVERTNDGVQLAGSTAVAMAGARLGDRVRIARRLRDQWLRALDHRASPRDLARLSLLSNDAEAAWTYAVRAALQEDQVGRYGEARSWLLLTESLAQAAPDDPEMAFDLAWVKARVALRTDPLTSRRTLLAAAEAMATTELQLLRVRTLETGYAMREGATRRALAMALHVGTQGEVDPATAARALLVAVQVRLGLGDTLAARRELDRATELCERADDSLLELEVAGFEAEMAWHARELPKAEKMCRANLARARTLRSVLGEATALSRLAAILRLNGDRTQAESQARMARDAFRTSGDVVLDAESRLALATLEAERGELVEARARLDTALRHIQGLRLDHLLPSAMRLALRIAAARADVSDANVALGVLSRDPTADDEAPAALVRWWRARGDLDRALRVPRPTDPGFGRGLWHVERARVRLAQADDAAARQEAKIALVIAGLGGFLDLMLYARLIVEGLGDADEKRFTKLKRRASASPWVDLALACMDVQARRDPDRARGKRTWRTLAARARELGYQSDAEDAEAWLGAG